MPRFVKVLFGATVVVFCFLVFQIVRRFTHAPPLPVLATVPAFTMKDQAGRQVTDVSLRGSVFIADFFFTSCQASCPRLMGRMKDVAAQLDAKKANVKLVSFTVDPENDDPARLTTYASKLGVDAGRWSLLTTHPAEHPHEELERVIVQGFKVHYVPRGAGSTKVEESINLMTIMHGDYFVLVDAQGRIRGYYDTKVPERLTAVVTDALQLAKTGT